MNRATAFGSLFCGPGDCRLTPNAGGNYRLAANSPALAANNDCGSLMGAKGLGCGDITPVRSTTWGGVETRFGDNR